MGGAEWEIRDPSSSSNSATDLLTNFKQVSYFWASVLPMYKQELDWADRSSNLLSSNLKVFALALCLSLQFSCSVMSNSLWPHGLQHTRPPCPSPTPRDYSNSCPSSQWCHPTISSCRSPLLPPSIFPSIKVFSSDSLLFIRWPEYWSFSLIISPSNEYSGVISFRMDWLNLLAVQGTLKSLLQHHSSEASILQCSAFFIVQLSHPYMTTGKTTALPRQTLLAK